MNRTSAPASLLLATALTACGGSLDDDAVFVGVLPTPGHAPGGPMELSGNWFVYLQEETSPAGNQDLNGDGDDTDSVAVAVSMGGVSVFPLAVAPTAAHIVGDQIYLEVEEATDGRDWNGDGMMDDLVLVHWAFVSAQTPNGMGICNAEDVCYVADLERVPGRASAAVAGTRLYYLADVSAMDLALAGDGATTLRALEQGAPSTPIQVAHLDTGQRRPRFLDADSEAGLLFLVYDEMVEGADQNGDLDTMDTHVLALLDATQPMRGIRSTGFALQDEQTPVRARFVSAGADRLVAFLVSEASQGATSLNDRDLPEFLGTGWEPVQCTNRDTDATDLVAHYLLFEPWLADPVMAPVRNTGLVGRDPAGPQRLAVVEGYVAVLSDEASADCDLNVDMDTADTVLRWVEALADPMMPLLPPGQDTELHAVAATLPGGSQGFTPLANRFVIVVDEMLDGEDIDASGTMDSIVGWRDPANPNPAFQFQHPTGGLPTAGAAWMSDGAREGLLTLSFQESVQERSLNSACQSTSEADADTVDELPTWLRFSGSFLTFPGIGYALTPARGGTVVAGSFAYFRVSEVEHGRDVNGDGDATDVLMVRNPVFACRPQIVFDTVDDATPDGSLDVLTTDGGVGGAFCVSETTVGADLNDNGFVGEDVILYFPFF